MTMHNNRGKILWIDDEIEHLKPHILFLEEKGYEISISNNGQDGILKANNEVFDLVLLDLFIPELDSIDELKIIIGINTTKPVIIIKHSCNE